MSRSRSVAGEKAILPSRGRSGCGVCQNAREPGQHETARFADPEIPIVQRAKAADPLVIAVDLPMAHSTMPLLFVDFSTLAPTFGACSAENMLLPSRPERPVGTDPSGPGDHLQFSRGHVVI